MDNDRFRKILGLLGSDQPGEVAAAASKATAMLKAEGLTWASVGPGASAAPRGPDPTEVLILMSKLGVANQEISRLHIRIGNTEDQLTRAKKDLLKAMVEVNALKAAAAKAPPTLADYMKPAMRYSPEDIERMRPGDFDPRVKTGTWGENLKGGNDPDALAREAIEEVLNDCRSGAIQLADGTEQFLRSVGSRKEWTLKQREAVERTLKWVHANTKKRESARW